MIKLEDYRNKSIGCWYGKNIGGTLGAPMEWKRQINDVSFYVQELNRNASHLICSFYSRCNL